MSNRFEKKYLYLLFGFLVFLVIAVIFSVILLNQNSINLLNFSTLPKDLSREELLVKYPFKTQPDRGILPSKNSNAKMDVWGTFEGKEGGVLNLKVYDDVLKFVAPDDILVFQGTLDPQVYKYLNYDQVSVGTPLVVTLLEQKDSDQKYVVNFVQIPIQP